MSRDLDERETVLNVNRVEGIPRLGQGHFFCKVVIVPFNDNIAEQKFRTSTSKDGIWDQDFSIIYGHRNDDVIFEVCEQRWFRETLVSSTKLTVGEILEIQEIRLYNSPGCLYVRLYDNNKRTKERKARRLSGSKRMKSELSSEGSELHMSECFQKKLEAHWNAVENFDSMSDVITGESEEELRKELVALEDQLFKKFNTKKKRDSIRPTSDIIENDIRFLERQDPSHRISCTLNNSFKLDTSGRISTSMSTDSLPQLDEAPVHVLVYEERVKSLQKELEMERGHVAILKKRNVELEAEVQRKSQELEEFKGKDSMREKLAWEKMNRIEAFEEKLKRMESQRVESEREVLRDLERRLQAREMQLEKREEDLQQTVIEMKSQNDAVMRKMKEQSDPHVFLSVLEKSKWNPPQTVILEERLSTLSSQLSKLDQLDEVMNRLDSMAANSSLEKPKRSAATIRSEIDKLQVIIMSDVSDKKERETANMKIDRLFTELFNTEEYKADIKHQQQEKIRINEPLNKQALSNVLRRYSVNGNDEELSSRKKQYPALALIGLEANLILGKHQNDFNQFLLGDLCEEELRAIRASLPVFKKDQRKQLEFVETLELKIDQCKGKSAAPRKVKKAYSYQAFFPKSQCGAMMADLVAELEGRKNNRRPMGMMMT